MNHKIFPNYKMPGELNMSKTQKYYFVLHSPWGPVKEKPTTGKGT